MKDLLERVRKIKRMLEGGTGSGNFGHAGRAGEVGGSGGGGGEKPQVPDIVGYLKPPTPAEIAQHVSLAPTLSRMEIGAGLKKEFNTPENDWKVGAISQQSDGSYKVTLDWKNASDRQLDGTQMRRYKEDAQVRVMNALGIDGKDMTARGRSEVTGDVKVVVSFRPTKYVPKTTPTVSLSAGGFKPIKKQTSLQKLAQIQTNLLKKIGGSTNAYRTAKLQAMLGLLKPQKMTPKSFGSTIYQNKYKKVGWMSTGGK